MKTESPSFASTHSTIKTAAIATIIWKPWIARIVAISPVKFLDDGGDCDDRNDRDNHMETKLKRNDPMCDPWDSQGDEKKCNFYFCCLLP